MGVEQRTGPGTNPRISRVVSKSNIDHGTATTAHRTLVLMPAGTICRSNLSLSHYPLQNWSVFSVTFPIPKKANFLFSRIGQFYLFLSLSPNFYLFDTLYPPPPPPRSYFTGGPLSSPCRPGTTHHSSRLISAHAQWSSSSVISLRTDDERSMC